MRNPQLAAIPYEQMRREPIATAREYIRHGQYQSHTAGIGAGRLQANLAIMPASYALDFMRFCQRNPKPCPLVGVTDTGDPVMHTVGDVDIRTDLPRYNVYENGKLSHQCTDITDLWQADSVAFAIGCSFTFETALIKSGIRLTHIEQDRVVAMYRTSLQTVPAGPFGGGMVVSMRAIPNRQIDRVVELSRKFPHAHGAPVHIGDPAQIGITHFDQPDWGDTTRIEAGHTPVFWACGVTPQNAITRAGLPLFISHTPGSMLITDVPEDAEVPVLTN